MDWSNAAAVEVYLQAAGYLCSKPNLPERTTLASNTAETTNLTNSVVVESITGGGVSSDVIRVQTPQGMVVLKRALHKLRVKEDWFANTNRNTIERLCLQKVSESAPEFVPKVLFVDETHCLFAMEYIEGPTWKHELLDRRVDLEVAACLGAFLADLHRRTSESSPWLKPLTDKMLFYQLRISPYFEFILSRYNECRACLNHVIDEMMNTTTVLVHGDFSPKNVLIRKTHTAVAAGIQLTH